MSEEVVYPEGNCRHEVSIETKFYEKRLHIPWGPKYETGEWDCPPVVWVINDNDSYYGECFKSRRALNGFIKRLQAARDKAWPSK